MSQPPNYRPAPRAPKLQARDDEWPPDWLDEKPRPAKRKAQPQRGRSASGKNPGFTTSAIAFSVLLTTVGLVAFFIGRDLPSFSQYGQEALTKAREVITQPQVPLPPQEEQQQAQVFAVEKNSDVNDPFAEEKIQEQQTAEDSTGETDPADLPSSNSEAAALPSVSFTGNDAPVAKAKEESAGNEPVATVESDPSPAAANEAPVASFESDPSPAAANEAPLPPAIDPAPVATYEAPLPPASDPAPVAVSEAPLPPASGPVPATESDPTPIAVAGPPPGAQVVPAPVVENPPAKPVESATPQVVPPAVELTPPPVAVEITPTPAAKPKNTAQAPVDPSEAVEQTVQVTETQDVADAPPAEEPEVEANPPPVIGDNVQIATAVPEPVPAAPIEQPETTATTPPPVATPVQPAPEETQQAVAITPAVAPQKKDDFPYVAGQVFRDCGNCPELVVAVPVKKPGAVDSLALADRFFPPGGGPLLKDDDNKVKPYAIGRVEITFDDWARCVSAGACQSNPDDSGWGRNTRPVINVSFNAITEQYLPWLSREAGKEYRLPTAEEWDFAADGGPLSSNASFLINASNICQNANVAEPSVGTSDSSPCADGYPSTAPVGSLKPNLLGVYDMRGNVWEWVSDCWSPGFTYKVKDSDKVCSKRLLRGGSWSSQISSVLEGGRGWEGANKAKNTIGFRVVRSLP